MSFSKYLNVNPSFQYTPSIPGMDLGNFGNIKKFILIIFHSIIACTNC